ncbi:ParB/RepB/Spo0J family partition protein [Massilia sp. TSP1-1-2]|uniref:ParB/RepB/Spo0J family partition protein n=1 Tax=Massilia sp. TSP1-1-2 TaxID=2804649 RepID=UPI003CF3EA6D
MSGARKPLKVSGLIAQGKLAPAAGVEQSHAFDPQVQASEQPEPEHVPGTKRPTAGAFSLEAARYENIIADLRKQLQAANDHAPARKIPLDLIDDSPYQPRLEIDPEEIDELAKTMAAAHQADPIKVRKVGNRYELISGHRRTKAARTLGWTEIEAVVEQRTDDEAEVEAMLLVVGSIELGDYELAKMYHRALTKGICRTQETCATFFATKQPYVSGRLQMLKLPSAIVAMLDAKPRLFGYECALVIKDLIKDHPGHLDVIVRGVSRLGDGMKQNSLKGWVKQTIKQGEQQEQQDERKTITFKDTPVFTTKRAKNDPRSVLVSCKIPGMDVSVFEEKLRAWLQEQAEQAGELVKNGAI